MKLKDTVIYEGFLKLVNREVNGVNREIILLDEAVAVLLMNSDKNKILLVKQFRASVPDYTWEIPAGMMDKVGESKEECIIRELEEEANIVISDDALEFENMYYPNIGSSNHKLTLYSAITDNIFDSEIEEDDVVEARWFDISEVNDMIDNGYIVDGKTILLFYKLFGRCI